MDAPRLPYPVAILDDFQGVALEAADWSRLTGKVSPIIFRQPLGAEDQVVDALRPFPIVVAMRERTAFPRSTLARLPELKLLVTTGSRNSAPLVLQSHLVSDALVGSPFRAEMWLWLPADAVFPWSLEAVA